MTDRYIEASIRVGDGMPGISDEDLIADLAHMVHDDAADHYGRSRWSRDCHYHGFAGPNGRAEFEAVLREMPPAADAEVGLYLAEWDEAIRPIAVIHWWEETIH